MTCENIKGNYLNMIDNKQMQAQSCFDGKDYIKITYHDSFIDNHKFLHQNGMSLLISTWYHYKNFPTLFPQII